jgi:AcrR family transcriptional regulator
MSDSRSTERGRKRSEKTRGAILAAAYELTLVRGFDDVTIEGIAARAGAGKQTIYRWWESKADVVFEALAQKADLNVSIADHGSFAADLGAFLRDSAILLTHAGVVPTLRALMSEAQRDARFRRKFQEAFLQRRRLALEAVIRRATDRGDAPTKVPTDLCVDLIFGLIWYRVLASEPRLTESDIAAMQHLLAASEAGAR